MTARLLPALTLGLVFVAGCTLEVPVECVWSLELQGPPGSNTVELEMDLSEQDELWTRRDAVEEIEVDRIRVTVTEAGEHNQADALQLALRLRADGAPDSGEEDLEMLSSTDLQLIEEAPVELAAPAGLGAALRDALLGSGKFTLVVEVIAERRVEATIQLALVGTVTSKL